jgi:hypothetical protein
LCRELNFPFCVEATSANLLAAQSSISDLPDDVVNAATSEASAMAVVADRYLVQRYKTLIEQSEPSQTCLNHWKMAICSEMFSTLGTAQTLCYETCDNVRKHCTGQFITEQCQLILNTGAPRGATCVDYAKLLADDTCVIGDASLNAPDNGAAPPPPPPAPGPPAPAPPPPIISPGAPNGGGSGGGAPVGNPPVWFNAGVRCRGHVSGELVLVVVVYLLAVLLERK